MSLLSSESRSITPDRTDDADDSQEHNLFTYRTFLEGTVDWVTTEDYLESALKLNSSMGFIRGHSSFELCIVLSSDNKHIATITSSMANRELTIEVFSTGNLLGGTVWKSQINVSHLMDNQGNSSSHVRLHGFLSNDGNSALIYCSWGYDREEVFVTSDRGTTWVARDIYIRYGFDAMASVDNQYLFLTGSGGKFKGTNQSEILEAYSVKTWELAKSWTFDFGNDHYSRTLRPLLSPTIDKPIWCFVEDSRFSSFNVPSPEHLFSSSGQQFQVDGVATNSLRAISPDGKHLVYVTRDDGCLLYWDLTHPTYKPLMTVRLPEVEVGRKRIHTIFGKEFLLRDSIAKQVKHIRFSPGGRVVTVVITNPSTIIILSFLIYNFQLVYKQVENYALQPGLHFPLQVCISQDSGVSVVGGSPHSVDSNGAKGLLVTFYQVQGAYDRLTTLENYFDSASTILTKFTTSVSGEKQNTQLIHQWKISERAIRKTAGSALVRTSTDFQYIETLRDWLFQSGRYLNYSHDSLVHLMTISYPWDSTSKVLLFAVRLKYDFSIITMAVLSHFSSTPYLLRVLYCSDTSTQGDEETVEIYNIGSHFLLHVETGSDHFSSYVGMPLPSRRTTLIDHHFLPDDAAYDLIIIKASPDATMPNGYSTSPNPVVTFTASFAAYFPDGYMGCGSSIEYGQRVRSEYAMARLLIWLDYTHRGNKDVPIFGGGELTQQLSDTYSAVFQDRLYDDRSLLFPSILATAAVVDYLSNRTILVDEFLKLYHRSDDLILKNSQSISCALPVLCRTRPLGALSLMRHFTLFKFHLSSINAVQVSQNTYQKKLQWYSENKLLRLTLQLFGLIKFRVLPRAREIKLAQANATTVTIPLDGFSTYDYRIYTNPEKLSESSWKPAVIQIFFDLATRSYYENNEREGKPCYKVPSRTSVKGPTSPFSCLSQEIFRLCDMEFQHSFMQVLWFERLILWKMDHFARNVFLARIALPNFINVGLHLALSLLTLNNHTSNIITVLASIQVVVCAFWATQKFRQARGNFLFFHSIFNYLDVISIGLSITMAALCLLKHIPARSFLAYSMPVLWINLVLITRVYERAGTLMILVTEMIKGVFPFLVLLALFIIGFTFIPFFLLHGISLASDPTLVNPFNAYSRSLGEVINFMASEFDELTPWKDSLISIQILQSLFTVVISILLLNVLIALLNLKVEAAENRSRQIWIRQMLALLLETEKGLLTDAERRDKRLFPRWFTYTVSEEEARAWKKHLNAHPLDLGYDGDQSDGSNGSTSAPGSNGAGGGNSLNNNARQSSGVESRKKDDSSSGQKTEKAKVTVDKGMNTEPISVVTNNSSANMKGELCGDNRVKVEKKTAPSPEKLFSQGSQANAPGSEGPSLPAWEEPSGGSASLKKCAEPTCTRVGDNICTGCRKVRYCGRDHQLLHWEAHKTLCKGKMKET